MTNVAPPPNAVDLAGLSDLRRRAQHDEAGALAEAAVQFEALFIGMMLESARSASLGSGIFDSPETEQYLELMDRQVALDLAKRGGFGFGKLLIQQLGERDAVPPTRPGASAIPAPPPAAHASGRLHRAAPAAPPPRSEGAEFPAGLPASLAALGGAKRAEEPAPPTPDEFVRAILPEAEAAAAALGIEPRLLLAQAALETGWGRAVPRNGPESANNLFGIKAGGSWSGPAVEHWTLEHEDGVTAPRLERFRAYGSAAESFADYVDLISTARRYADALAKADDPEAYARALTEAGYATDPAYADKWLAIYHGERLERALSGIAPAAPAP
jgi:flagellar protein FlgJ